MDFRRRLKQVIYSGIYLILFTSVIFGGYFLFKKEVISCFDRIQNQSEEGVDCGEVCGNICLEGVKPIQVVSTKVITNIVPQVLIEFKNPNQNLGVKKLSYVINFYDGDDKKIKSSLEETFLYAGESQKYIVRIYPDISNLARVEIELGDLTWVKVENFKRPNMLFIGVKHLSTEDEFISEGAIKSEFNLPLKTVTISSVYFDNFGNVVGLSKTELYDIKALDESYFKVVYPLDTSSIVKEKTRLYYEAKY